MDEIFVYLLRRVDMAVQSWVDLRKNLKFDCLIFIE
jgi:hypothetical protein